MFTMRKLAAAIVVFAFALSVSTTSQASVTTTKPIPAVDLSATPAGWVPVACGDAQVSVPASWSVYYPGWIDCGFKRDGLYLGPATATTAGCFIGVSPRTTQVYLRHIDRLPSQYASEKPVNLNGVAVYIVPSYGPYPVLDYYAPSIGVEVIATGPLARRIVDTLARSPRAVALAKGPPPSVPASWHKVSFVGLVFRAPRSWSVLTTVSNYGIGEACTTPGVAFFGTRILLSVDKELVRWNCQVRSRLEIPTNGVQVDTGQDVGTGQYPPLHLVFGTNCLLLHGLRACPATSPAYSILVLKVTVPGRSKPVYVSIGLAGNGMVARTILYSIRAA